MNQNASLSCNISKNILNKILYISISFKIIYCVIQVKEIKQKITSNAENFIILDECLNCFFINKIIENEEFLLTSELLNTYEFHKIKDENASIIMIGDIIAILDSNYRFLKLQLQYTNSSNHNQEIKIISKGSYDLKVINETINKYNIQDFNNTENKTEVKMFQSSQSDQLFILSEKRLYKVSINNPLDSIIKGNHLFIFTEVKNRIDDIAYYSEQGMLFIASGGDVLIYQESNSSSLLFNFMGKVKGLQFDLLYIKKLMIYKSILLVVDQQNGIFFIGLPNNQNKNIQQQMQFRNEIKRLPLQIIASDVVDIYINDKTIIVVESEESNSLNVVITEYHYNEEQSLVIEIKEIAQRYSNYQKGAIISEKFFFISNFAIHYIYLLQNYSKSSKAISSIFDEDDFDYNDDKIVTNTMSVRIHNLIVLDSFKSYKKPLLIGLESKKLSVYNLEFSSPSVDIKYNDNQQQEDSNSNNINYGNYTYSTDEENIQYKQIANKGTTQDEQKNKKQQKQLTTSCAVFNCSNILKYYESQLQLGKIQQDQIQINTQIYDENEVLVFTDFCIITKEIDLVPLVAISWFKLLIENEYLYYGLLSSIASLPITILVSKLIIKIKCKFRFNINIFTPLKKKIKSINSDKQLIIQVQQAEDNQNGFEQFQIDEQCNDKNPQDNYKTQKNIQINEISHYENQKMRVKKIGIQSVGNQNQQQKQTKQHQQTASEYSKVNGINLPNEFKESVKQFQKSSKNQQDQNIKYYQSQSKTAKNSKNSYPPEETPQNDSPLVTEILNTEIIQTESDDKPLFKVTKLNHDDK